MPAAVCNGASIHYERLGGPGPQLLYCNGSGSSLSAVRPLLDLFASRFDLLAFDYRGLGASEPAQAPYAMADVAADVAALLDTVGWARTAVAGLSYGGMVAQEFAVSFPDRVQRLALMATSPGGAWPSYPLDELTALPAAERAERGRLLADRRWSAQWLASHPRDLMLAKSLGGDSDSAATEPGLTGRTLQLQARRGHDVLDRLHRVKCPTMVASGAYDDIAPVVNGQAITDRIRGATLRVYDGGHLFLLQDPAAWPEVAQFLAE